MISRIVDVFEAVNAWVRRALGNVFLTLFIPAYFGISFGLGRVRVPILFGNDLLLNDLPYSKGLDA